MTLEGAMRDESLTGLSISESLCTCTHRLYTYIHRDTIPKGHTRAYVHTDTIPRLRDTQDSIPA